MKNIFYSGVAIAAIGWGMWTLATPDECERIHRGSAPLRMTFDLVEAGVHNWAQDGERASLTRFADRADAGFQAFLARQFFGKQNMACPKNTAPDEADKELTSEPTTSDGSAK